MFTHSRINENIESSTYNPEQMLGYSRNKTLCTEKKKKKCCNKAQSFKSVYIASLVS